MSQETNALDEALGSAGRSVRMTVMMAGQAAEVVARRVAEKQRRATEESRERTSGLEQSYYASRDTAREAYEPVAKRNGFASSDQETAVAAWATAKAWADVDPRAAQAQASLSEQIKERWGVDPESLFPESPADREQEPLREPEAGQEAEQESRPENKEPAEAPQAEADLQDQRERFAQAMDPEWRESASDTELERLWHEANNAGDHVGAPEARTALDQALADRHGLDLEKFHQQLEHGLGDDLWNAQADRAGLDADDLATSDAERKAAGWENEAAGQHSREANADDPALEAEESVDASEAEGMANAFRGEAAAEQGEAQAESRADVEAMNESGVPPRSQEVRTSTARGFGTTTQQGAQAKHHRRARKSTRPAAKGADKELGR